MASELSPEQLQDRVELYRGAACRLVGPRGAWCAGWLDGLEDRSPDAARWQHERFVEMYEEGWMEGAETALAQARGEDAKGGPDAP